MSCHHFFCTQTYRYNRYSASSLFLFNCESPTYSILHKHVAASTVRSSKPSRQRHWRREKTSVCEDIVKIGFGGGMCKLRHGRCDNHTSGWVSPPPPSSVERLWSMRGRMIGRCWTQTRYGWTVRHSNQIKSPRYTGLCVSSHFHQLTVRISGNLLCSTSLKYYSMHGDSEAKTAYDHLIKLIWWMY